MKHFVPFVTAIVSKLCGDGTSLVQGNSYAVVEISSTDYRVIDQIGEPCIYPRTYFLEDDLKPPKDWILENFDEGEYWATPVELTKIRLFEDYFDDNQDAIDIVNKFVAKIAIPDVED